MGNIISVLKQIFTGKEDCSTHVGISEFKKNSEPIQRFKKVSGKKVAVQQLRLSELMRKA